jgi:5'-nucleotidase/UDP-sugar diphosphatase
MRSSWVKAPIAVGLLIGMSALAGYCQEEAPTAGLSPSQRPRKPPRPPAQNEEAAPVADGTFQLEILHTNDIHGYVKPGFGGRGGIGAVANVVEKARARAKTDKDYDVLVLDGGDLTGGGPEDAFSRGKMMKDAIAAVRYDVWEPGNHDFGYGLPVLWDIAKTLKDAGTLVVGANIVSKAASAPQFTTPHVIIERKGFKIGIIGAITPGTDRMNLDENVEGYAFPDPVSIVTENVAQLKKEGANLVIMLSHVGLENGKYMDDKKIAAAVDGVDVIVGGHTHTAMERPFVDSTHHTVIVQAGQHCQNLGSLKIFFDAAKHEVERTSGTVKHEYKLMDLGKESGANPIVDKLKAAYWDPVAAQLAEKLGTGEVGLYRKFYKVESNLGNFVADAMLESAPGAQIALSAASELRADIRKGDITVKDVFDAIPFDNEVVTLKVSGKFLKDLFDGVFDGGRHFLHIAGMKLSVDSRKPAGERVLSMTVGDKPVTDGEQYAIATTDFVCQGKGGFKEFQHPPYTKVGISNRDSTIKHIKKLGTIADHAVLMRRIRDAAMYEEIGKVTKTFGTDTAVPGPNLYDIVANGMLGKPARADIALVDTYGIHWKLSEKFPVVKQDIFELSSYDNTIVKAKITGAQLVEVFKSLVKTGQNGQMRLNGWLAGGNLVADAQSVKLLINDKEVDAGKEYTLITTDRILNGSKGFEKLGSFHLHGEATGLMTRSSLEDWIKKSTPIGAESFPARPTVVLGGQTAERTVTNLRNFEAIHEGAPVPQTAVPAAAH